MATINTIKGGTSGHPTRRGVPSVYVAQNVVDFTKNPAEAADVVLALAVPAKTLVLDVQVEVLAGTAGTGTVAVGDAATANRYVAAAVPDSEGFMTATGTKRLFAAAGDIRATVAVATIDDAILRVTAVLADMSEAPVNGTARDAVDA